MASFSLAMLLHVLVALTTLTFVQGEKKVIYNVHLAMSGDPSQMWVSWKTTHDCASMVKFGTSPNSYDLAANGYSTTHYDAFGGYNHNVLLTQLKADTTYYYIAGDTAYAMSQEFNFTTMPAAGSSFTIGVYGDLGVQNGYNTSDRVVARAVTDQLDWILHMGDISYANDRPWEYETVWDEWFTEMEPAMAHLPYQVAVGNHESWCRNPVCAIQTANFTTFKEKFSPMASNISGTTTNMFYSFDYLNAHFIVISTETDYPGYPIDLVEQPGGRPVHRHASVPVWEDDRVYEQVVWLEQDLQKAAANRANVPWIIVTGHRPIYSDVDKNSLNGVPEGQCAILQAWLEPLFKKYSVDLYLAGHQHSYSRTYPVFNNVVSATNFSNPVDTVHVTAGGAGNVEDHDLFNYPIPDWQAGGLDSEYGYGVLSILSDEELLWEYHISATDAVYDSFTLTKDRSNLRKKRLP